MADENTRQDAWRETAKIFYNQFAEVKAQAGFYRAFVRNYRGLRGRVSALQSSKTDSPCCVLDVGCGAGELAGALQGPGISVIGIDISGESLRVAQTRGVGWFVQADMAALPFPENSFEGAAAMTSLEFCREKHKALSEIFRVLKRGGFCYVEVRSGDFFLCRLPAPFRGALEKWGLTARYPAEAFRDLTRQEWIRLFSAAGYSLEKEYPSLRPVCYGSLGTRFKNMLVLFIKNTFPLRYHYMCGFLLVKT